MNHPDIHEGKCPTCKKYFYRDFTYLIRHNANEEAIFAQISALIRPYCNLRCVPRYLMQRLRALVDDPRMGQGFSLPLPDPEDEEGESCDRNQSHGSASGNVRAGYTKPNQGKKGYAGGGRKPHQPQPRS